VDLSNAQDSATLRALLAGTPGGSEFVASPRCQDVEDFVLNMSEGDFVITPSKGTTDILIRQVAGPYQYCPADPDGLHLHRQMQPGKRRDVAGRLRSALTHPQIAVFQIVDPAVVTELQALRDSTRIVPK
jgi:predicted Mrr-cat superfamily restriction endonuclease